MDFFIDYLVAFRSKLASLLLDRGMVRVNLEPVYHNFRVNSGHVLVGPSEAIMVLLEELVSAK